MDCGLVRMKLTLFSLDRLFSRSWSSFSWSESFEDLSDDESSSVTLDTEDLLDILDDALLFLVEGIEEEMLERYTICPFSFCYPLLYYDTFVFLKYYVTVS